MDAATPKKYSSFGAFLTEYVARRVGAGPLKIENGSKNEISRIDGHLGPQKIASGRGFGEHMNIL